MLSLVSVVICEEFFLFLLHNFTNQYSCQTHQIHPHNSTIASTHIHTPSPFPPHANTGTRTSGSTLKTATCSKPFLSGGYTQQQICSKTFSSRSSRLSTSTTSAQAHTGKASERELAPPAPSPFHPGQPARKARADFQKPARYKREYKRERVRTPGGT